MNHKIKLTRKEIYKRIWNRPMRDVAKELNMSDVGLAKLCRRNGIPTPPSGYHLMKPGIKKNKSVRALPKIEPGQQDTFHFHMHPVEEKPESPDYKSQFESIITTLPESLTPSQRRPIKQCLKHIRSKLRKRLVDDRGIMRIPNDRFPVRVSPHSLDRAFELLESYLDSALLLGASIDTHKLDREDALLIQYEQYDFMVNIEEFSKREAVPPEKRPKRQFYTMPSDAWKLVPTHKLEMRLNGPGYGNLTIRDGKHPIEAHIEKLLMKMHIRALEQRDEDELKAIRKERAIAYLKEKDKIRQYGEHQALKQKQLYLEARQWRKADSLRQYIKQVELRGYDISSSNFSSHDEWQAWLTWAKEHIDSLDPLTNGTSGITPPYPAPKDITEVPYNFLQFDDPKEADQAGQQHRYW